MEKTLLSDFLRKKVQEKYGSISSFAESAGLTYERVKKAIQRNNFSRDDLELFTEKLGLVNLNFDDFEYKLSRRASNRNQVREPLIRQTVSGIVPEEFISFVVHNPVVLERIKSLVAHECRRIFETINEQ